MNHSPKGNEKEEYRYDPKTLNNYKEIMSTTPRRKGSWVDDLYHFENLSSLKVNESGTMKVGANALAAKNCVFFRKGQVGNWKNHLTPEMAKQIN
ncbi:hypothetical protein SO802_007858 [Lithocarpus litseifolius]|uniref:Sulfotransferase n=1 Tax=Lithocarpus litseifolius TaxID=425828 RepID=A0AAW2DPU9_9ROSI